MGISSRRSLPTDSLSYGSINNKTKTNNSVGANVSSQIGIPISSKAGITMYGDPGLRSYDTNDIYSTLSGNYSYSGGAAYRPDVSGVIASYENAANNQRNQAQTTYNNTRTDLLDSIKRFRDENAKNVKNQKQIYLTNQSTLDSAKEMANRANITDAAARGLGGSGLQQLAELQNDLNLQQDASQLANTNQSIRDELALALSNREEDTNKSLDRALTDYNNTINSINSNLELQKAQANYEADQIYQSMLANQRASQSAYQSGLNSSATSIYNTLNNYNTALQRDLKSVTSKAGADKVYQSYVDELDALMKENALSTKTYKDAIYNLEYLLNQKKSTLKK